MAENDMVVVKEEPKDPEDNDIVTTNSEMVLDDILGDDIIGESSDQETEKGRKKIKAPKSEPAAESSKRSRNNSYASDLSSTGSISKRSSKPVDWHNLEARYFVIKSNNMDNVEISMEKSLWATPRRNEDMLVEAFRHTKHVILIFSVRESGAFQGVARMMSMPKPNKDEVHWIVGSTPVLRLLPNIFKIQWLDRSPLEFTKTTHLKNKWNEWKQVKIARDGTEVEPNCAAQLCSMWTNSEDPDSHIPTITSRHRPSESAARAPRVEEPVSPSAVKTTYSSYKDDSYHKSSPEPMSDGEPAPPGLSSRMKERLGGSTSRPVEEEKKKRSKKEEVAAPPRAAPPRRDYKSSKDTRADNRPSHRGNRDGPRQDRRTSDNARSSRSTQQSRHRSRSPGPSASSSSKRRASPPVPEKNSAKDILLHGTYLDYVREYQSKHSRLAALLQDPVLRQDIFNAAQVAATNSTSSSTRQSSSSSRRRKDEKYLDSRAHSALVDEFLSTHNRR